MNSYNINNDVLMRCANGISFSMDGMLLSCISRSANSCTLTHPIGVEMLQREMTSAAIEFICDVRRKEVEGHEADWKGEQWWFVLKQEGGQKDPQHLPNQGSPCRLEP